jgi:hypothetical protein
MTSDWITAAARAHCAYLDAMPAGVEVEYG